MITMKTKQQVIDWLESNVGTTVACKGNPSLDGQCVTLIKALMEFIGVPDPYKARGHAKSCIATYLSEGIAGSGTGFLSVFSSKNMGDGYGHIWCNAGDDSGTFYEQNGQKALIVTKGKTYTYDTVCNFDKYIVKDNEAVNPPMNDELEKLRLERDDNWRAFTRVLEPLEISANPSDKMGTAETAVKSINAYKGNAARAEILEKELSTIKTVHQQEIKEISEKNSRLLIAKDAELTELNTQISAMLLTREQMERMQIAVEKQLREAQEESRKLKSENPCPSLWKLLINTILRK